MFDIGGFLTSTEFFLQIASIITALLAAIADLFIGGLFAGA